MIIHIQFTEGEFTGSKVQTDFISVDQTIFRSIPTERINKMVPWNKHLALKAAKLSSLFINASQCLAY